MTTSASIETVNEAKRQHVGAVLDMVDQVRDLIRSQPDLWFGGLPPILGQFESMFAFHANQVREQFGLPAVVENPA